MPDQAQEAGAPDELAQIQAERAKLAEAKSAREASASSARQLSVARQALDDEKALADAEEKYGSSYVLGDEKCDGHALAVVRTPSGSIIVKRPHPPTFNKFVDGKRTHEDVHTLVQTVTVYPKDRLHKILDTYPGIAVQCANAAVELANGRSSEVGGK